jgi:hypothetical protein
MIDAPSPVMDRRTIKACRLRAAPQRRRTTLTAVALSSIIVAGLSIVVAPGGIGQTNTWTFMVYLAADNNLERWAIDDFLEMSSVGSTDDLNIVVQFDRIAGYDDRYDDWSGTMRYLVTAGMTPTIANATEDLGEVVNMGDPATLIDFVGWAVTNYPANHHVLVLWDHGADWRGVCWDYSSSNDYLDMYEIDYALDTIMFDNADLFYDVLAFDACSMGSIEVAYQVEPYAQYMVASEIGVPEAGFEYSSPLAALASNPDMTALDLCNEILDAYSEYYLSLLGTPLEFMLNESFTLSITDLGELSALASTVHDLALALIGNMTAWVNHVDLARAGAEEYNGAYSDDIVDLYHISERLRDIIPNGSIDALATAVMDSVLLAVIAEVHGTNPANPQTLVNHTHGLSIYFPADWWDYSFAYELWLYFTLGFSWDEFLNAYYDEISLGNPTVMYSSPEGTAVPTDSVIEIWFSEPMDFDSLVAAFSIDPYVDGNLSWDSDENKLTFTPTSGLSPFATYNVTIGTQATDTEGNHMTSSYTWQFSTGEVIPEFSDVVLPVLGMITVLAAASRHRLKRR